MGKIARKDVLRVASEIATTLKEKLKEYVIRKLNRKKRRWWIRDWIKRRPSLGASETIMKELAVEDIEMYKNVLRMSEQHFNTLLNKIQPLVSKQTTQLREALPVYIKLQITLRYLATGDSFSSLALLYRVPKTSISKFLPEVLQAIYNVLEDFIQVSSKYIF